MKGKLQELGEEYENVNALSKIQTQILNYTGVNIFDENDNFRDTYDILKDIAEVYDDLKSTVKADVTEILFGKMRANQGIAILQAFKSGQIEKAYEAVQNSAGTAEAEFEKWSQGIEAHLNNLTAAREAFSQSIIDDDAMKVFIDSGTIILNVLTDIIKQFGTLQTLIPIVFGALSAFKNVGIFTTMNDQLTGATGKLGLFGRTLNQIGNDLSQGKFASLFHLVPKSEITALQSYGQALLSNSNKIKNWDKALAKGKINQQTYNQTIENTVGSLKGLSTTSQLLGIKIKQLHSDFLAGKMSASEFTMQVNTLIGAQKAATVATQVLGTALKTAFNIGIGIAIGAIISWIQDLITENQRMAEVSKQAADEIKDELNGLEDYSEKIISLRKELESTNTTTERATDVRQELYDIQKDLIENYGAEKDSIDLVTGSIKDQIEELKNLGKQKYDSQYYSNYQATQTTLGNLNNLDLVLDDRAWRDYANQMWQNSNASRFRDDVQDYMKSVLESAGFKYEGGFYKLDGNAFDVNDALVSVEKQVEQAINSLDINDYPNPAAYADAEKQLRHVLEYLSAVNKDVTSPLIEHEEELAQYIKYNEKYSEQYWKLFTARANYEAAQERGIQEEIIAARKAFIDTYNALVIDEDDNAVSWWFEKEFGEVIHTSEKTANTVKQITYPVKESLNELNTQLEEVYNSFDSAFSNQSTIQSAFDKIQSGTDLTASEMRGLIKLCKKDFPEIGTLFTKTAKGYTISADNLIKANGAIMNSAKETVQAQIEGYQDIIDKYEEYQKKLSYIQDMSDMPDSVKQSQLKTLGITEEEYKAAKNELQNLLPLLDMFNISLSNTSESANAFNKAIENSTKQITFIKSAMEEMSENGYVSASTYQTLVEKGEKYVDCLDLINGKLVLNVDKLKNLETQQLRSLIIDNNIRISKLNESLAHGANADAIRDETNAIRGQNAALEQQIEDIWSAEPTKSGSSKNDDPIKEAFEKEMKDIEHLHNMGLKSDEEYYDALEKANERHYKNSVDHESDYLSNVEKIYKARQSLYKDDADKQFDDLEDQRKRGIITAEQYAQGLHDLGQELYGEGSIYGGTEFAIKALEELDKKVKETSEDIYDESLDSLKKNNDGTLKSEEQFIKDWTKLNDDTWKTINPKEWEENYNEIADYTQDFYKDLLDKGLLNPDQHKDKVQSFFYRLKSMGIDLGKNWLADALEIDDIEYDKLKESLSSDGDRALDDVLVDVEKLSEKNIKLFSDDPETLRKNVEDIFKSVLESAKDALDKMLITPDEYLQIIDKWGDKLNIAKGLLEEAKELSEDDYLDRWDLDNGYDENKSKDDYELRAKRIEYIYELAEQLYGKNGQKNLKAYNALINQGLEDVESLVKDYYDAEIKKLEKINDEEEKRQKVLELQLNLIKARQKLEEAKSQRNQLILENGVFRYDYDQEAVMSAQEDIAEAEKAILEQEREDQKEALENQKEETLKFFDSVGGKLDDFIDRVEKFLAGDKDAFKVNENKTDAKTDVEIENDNNSSDIKDKNIVSKITDISDVTKDTFNIAKTLADNFSFENLVRALGGNPTVEAVKNFQDSYNATLVGKQITPSTLPSNVTNNSSTTNNSAKTVNIGDIHLHLDLTVESLEDFVENKLEQFAQEVGDAFETEILRKMTSN